MECSLTSTASFLFLYNSNGGTMPIGQRGRVERSGREAPCIDRESLGKVRVTHTENSWHRGIVRDRIAGLLSHITPPFFWHDDN